MIWLLVLSVGLLAGTVGGIVGFGGSTILLPLLVLAFGPKEAVPIMGLAGVLANLSRVGVWWREIDWRAAGVYALTGVPAVALAAHAFVSLDARFVDAMLGGFMLAMIPARRWLLARRISIGLRGLAGAGAGIGLLTGLVASTGPVSTPFFLAYGLVKGAYIATEALGSFAVFATKTLVFRSLGALPADVAAKGLLVGGAMMAGSWAAKRVVLRLDISQFHGVMDAAIAVAGVLLLWASFH